MALRDSWVPIRWRSVAPAGRAGLLIPDECDPTGDHDHGTGTAVARLQDGPGDGYEIPDDSRDTEWVAFTEAPNGKRSPVLNHDGLAEVVPDVSPAAITGRWECYQRTTRLAPSTFEDSPLGGLVMATGEITYRWVCPCRPRPDR